LFDQTFSFSVSQGNWSDRLNRLYFENLKVFPQTDKVSTIFSNQSCPLRILSFTGLPKVATFSITYIKVVTQFSFTGPPWLVRYAEPTDEGVLSSSVPFTGIKLSLDSSA
jgi:hypothetical protein